MINSLNSITPMGNMLRLLISLIIVAFISSCSTTQPSYKYVNTSTKAPKTRNITPVAKPTSRPAPKKPSLKPNYPVYIVQKGDTLSSISRSSKLSIKEIQRYNNLKSTRLEIGQRIYLPGVYKLKQAKITPPPMSYSVSRNISIIPRSRWAKDKIKGNITPMGKVSKITVHHTADTKLTAMTDVKALQSIERHHRNYNKWACIGYHFIIGRDGTIYEGRPSKYQGAHARSNNSSNLGISLIGNFNTAYPTKQQLTSLSVLLGNFRSRHKISTKSVHGHRHLNQTECPGKYLTNWINRYRAGR